MRTTYPPVRAFRLSSTGTKIRGAYLGLSLTSDSYHRRNPSAIYRVLAPFSSILFLAFRYRIFRFSFNSCGGRKVRILPASNSADAIAFTKSCSVSIGNTQEEKSRDGSPSGRSLIRNSFSFASESSNSYKSAVRSCRVLRVIRKLSRVLRRLRSRS